AGSRSVQFAVIEPDTTAPDSSVAPLPEVSETASFFVQWQGTDNPGGAGLDTFDVYVSIDGAGFVRFLRRTELNSVLYSGEKGHSYAFYSVATDRAGNVEAAPTTADAHTAVLADLPGSVVGYVYDDVNANGQLDGDEHGLVNWTMYLDQNQNGLLDNGE